MLARLEKLKKSMTISLVVSAGPIRMVLLLVSLKNNENYQINKLIIFKHRIYHLKIPLSLFHPDIRVILVE